MPEPVIPEAPATERAWAAGFFDGEGHVNCGPYTGGRGGKRYYRPLASIAQNHREPLDRFQQIVGVGKVYGPYPGRGNSKPYWQYAVTSRRGVQAIYDAISAFLGSVKLAGFDRALAETCHSDTRTVRDTETGRFISAER